MAAGAALAMPLYFDTRRAFAFYQSPSGLKKFAQPLRGVGSGGIPVATADLTPAPITGVTHYSLTIGQFTDQLHPNLGPTTLWGYNPAGTQDQRHLGGIIVAQRGKPIQITFTNTLPSKHILPVDTSDNFPDAHLQNATTTHLHGGFTPWISDGGPFTWFTPDGQYGPSVESTAGNIYKLLNPGLQSGQAEYYYPNHQSARLGWYHDHAHDLTRLECLRRDRQRLHHPRRLRGRPAQQGPADFVENGGREIPIVIQDKIFVGADIATTDPTWRISVPRAGQPVVPAHLRAETLRSWSLPPQASRPLGYPRDVRRHDARQRHGLPEATVEARRYRLRVLNACQARFLNLQLYVDDGSPDGITLDPDMNPTNPAGPDFLVLGTEGGFLPQPVSVPANRPFDAGT